MDALRLPLHAAALSCAVKPFTAPVLCLRSTPSWHSLSHPTNQPADVTGARRGGAADASCVCGKAASEEGLRAIARAVHTRAAARSVRAVCVCPLCARLCRCCRATRRRGAAERCEAEQRSQRTPQPLPRERDCSSTSPSRLLGLCLSSDAGSVSSDALLALLCASAAALRCALVAHRF